MPLRHGWYGDLDPHEGRFVSTSGYISTIGPSYPNTDDTQWQGAGDVPDERDITYFAGENVKRNSSRSAAIPNPCSQQLLGAAFCIKGNASLANFACNWLHNPMLPVRVSCGIVYAQKDVEALLYLEIPRRDKANGRLDGEDAARVRLKVEARGDIALI